MATMNTGIVRESESKGTRSLLQCHGSERPQHKSHEEADEPHDAVGDAANAGRKDLGGERRARAPKTQGSETPGEAEDPEPKVACRIDPEGHEDRASALGVPPAASVSTMRFFLSWARTQ